MLIPYPVFLFNMELFRLSFPNKKEDEKWIF